MSKTPVNEFGLPNIVIPAELIFNENLTPKERELFGHINNMANNNYKYCWATNNHLGKLIKTNPKTITTMLSKLSKEKYINLKYETKYDGRTVRKIFINPNYPEVHKEMLREATNKFKNLTDESEDEDNQENMDGDTVNNVGGSNICWTNIDSNNIDSIYKDSYESIIGSSSRRPNKESSKFNRSNPTNDSSDYNKSKDSSDNNLNDVPASGRKSKKINGKKSIKDVSSARKPRPKSSAKNNEVIDRIIDEWNNQPNLTTHRKNTKTYNNIHNLINKLLNGNFPVETIKSDMVPNEWTRQKWTEDQIIAAIQTYNKHHYLDYWPPSKNGLKKNFDQTIYNQQTGNSWLMIAYKNYIDSNGPNKVELDPFSELSDKMTRLKNFFFEYYNKIDEANLSKHQKKQLIDFLSYVLDEANRILTGRDTVSEQDATEFRDEFQMLQEFLQYLNDEDRYVVTKGLSEFFYNWRRFVRGIELRNEESV